MTETEKMLAGKLYDAGDGELSIKRKNAHKLCEKYNRTSETKTSKRIGILKKLLPDGKNCFIQGPFYCDYGENIHLGENFYANFNFTVLDCCPVTIGNNVFIGPNVSLVTPVHPFRWQDRNMKCRSDGSLYDYEYAKPIVIGDNCWIASNVTVVGGVKIGSGCVIGAGSVVTQNIPDNSLAVGNPCRVIRQITDSDAVAPES